MVHFKACLKPRLRAKRALKRTGVEVMELGEVGDQKLEESRGRKESRNGRRFRVGMELEKAVFLLLSYSVSEHHTCTKV